MDIFELSPDGQEVKRDRASWKRGDNSLRSSREAVTRRVRDLGWTVSDTNSDIGHLRYYPRGALLFRLMESRIKDLIRERTGAEEIITPLLYRVNSSGIQEEARKFLKEMYHCGYEGNQFVLRPGGDFGAFSLAGSIQFQLRHLPFRVFECGPVFRVIQRGQLNGMAVARAFTMTDYHSFCDGHEMLWTEANILISAQRAVLDELNMQWRLVFEVDRDFFLENRNRYLELLRRLDCSAEMILLPVRKNYWSSQHRFHAHDGMGLMDGQLDLVNAAGYSILVRDGDGPAEPVSICHGWWGSIERWTWLHVCSAVQNSANLPAWFAPTQLRLIPCSEAGHAMARRLVDRARERRVRCDIDDRDKSASARLRLAANDLTFSTIVLGDREHDNEAMVVNVKTAAGELKQTSFDDWLTEVESSTRGYPYQPLSTSLLSTGISAGHLRRESKN